MSKHGSKSFAILGTETITSNLNNENNVEITFSSFATSIHKNCKKGMYNIPHIPNYADERELRIHEYLNSESIYSCNIEEYLKQESKNQCTPSLRLQQALSQSSSRSNSQSSIGIRKKLDSGRFSQLSIKTFDSKLVNESNNSCPRPQHSIVSKLKSDKSLSILLTDESPTCTIRSSEPNESGMKDYRTTLKTNTKSKFYTSIKFNQNKLQKNDEDEELISDLEDDEQTLGQPQEEEDVFAFIIK